MLDNLQRAVKYGESLGANFVEARYDDLHIRALVRINDNWKTITSKTRSGIAITCYYDGASGFSFTVSDDKIAIDEAVAKAYRIAKSSAPAVSLKLDFDNKPAVITSDSDIVKIENHPSNIEFEEKINLVNRAVETAKDNGKNISTIVGRYGEMYGQKLMTNSDGSNINWNFEVIDLRCNVTSKTESGAMVSGSASANGTAGFELFKKKTPESLGKKSALFAKEQLEAKSCPAGTFRALVDNDLAGVLAHETFGHLSEGDFVVTGASPLNGKIGTKLGTEHATIIDNGRVDVKKVGGIWIPFDDQGIKGGPTTILENGILKHYLHNRGTAKYLNQEPTGNSRAVHFGFNPIPRMTNTYFKSGNLSEEEALELLGTGVYAIQTSGGQVTLDGSFLFKAIRGYWVENGEKKYPLREVSLAGNILQLLGEVEGATSDFKLIGGYFGGCGKGGQYPLPTGMGGPKLVINGVKFGGKS